MRRLRTQIIGMCVIAFVGTALLISPVSSEAARWLDPELVRAERWLTGPPSPGSVEDKADFERIYTYQATRTEAECARSRAAGKMNLKNLFGLPYGTLSSARIAQLDHFFDRLKDEIHPITKRAKKLWKRERPFDRDPRIKTCGTDPDDFAFPSGHAFIATVFARTLSLIDPVQSGFYEARARQVAEDRVLAGLHFPTDVSAGARLADEVFALLLGEPGFLEEVQRLRDLPLRDVK